MPTTTAPLLHLTLNTGHLARTSGITAPEELAAVRPLLERGGPIPTRPPYHMDLHRLPGCASFCIYCREVPITLNILAWDPAAALSAWSEIERVYLNLSDRLGGAMAARACPAQPTSTPWLATLLLPTLALPGRTANELLWIGAFERVYAEALLAAA